MKDKKIQESKTIEFYEHTTKIDPAFCHHTFKRLSITRILCAKCGVGFFDDPYNTFPVDEMNKQIRKEKRDIAKKE